MIPTSAPRIPPTIGPVFEERDEEEAELPSEDVEDAAAPDAPVAAPATWSFSELFGFQRSTLFIGSAHQV